MFLPTLKYNGDVVGRQPLFVGQYCFNEVEMKGSIVVLVAICQINRDREHPSLLNRNTVEPGYNEQRASRHLALTENSTHMGMGSTLIYQPV